MNKIKIVFFILFFLIFIGVLFLLNIFKSPLESSLEKVPEFQVTRISKNGTVYQNTAMTEPFQIKKIKHPVEVFLKADAQTAFEFIYSGTFFSALPGTSLFQQSKTRELFINGDFFWKKEIRGKKVEIYLSSSEEIIGLSKPIGTEIQSDSQPIHQKILLLSDSGRITNSEETLKIWNYSGELILNMGNNLYPLKSNQMLILEKRNNRVTFQDTLPAPQYISPEEKTIRLNLIGDSIIKFGWKSVKDASKYQLRLYTSELRENPIFDREVTVSRKSIDILKFENESEIYWEVYPFGSQNNIEGTPSKMGIIKIVGAILDKEKLLKPPKLDISSLTVSGNMVLIKGEADANSQLFINDEFVKVDMDGKFIHTITFKTMGTKSIVFKLISPSEIESVFDRQVTIFVE